MSTVSMRAPDYVVSVRTVHSVGGSAPRCRDESRDGLLPEAGWRGHDRWPTSEPDPATVNPSGGRYGEESLSLASFTSSAERRSVPGRPGCIQGVAGLCRRRLVVQRFADTKRD
jgi:hypothetical protein